MKKIITLMVSGAMLVSSIPAFAMSANYSGPKFSPPSAHPRVMFTSANIPTIKANFEASQNENAYTEFQRLISDATFITTPITSLPNGYDHSIENQIEAFAFDYAINGNETSAAVAINREIEYLNKVDYSKLDNGLEYRAIGCTIFHAAEVFDWCYNYSGFTAAQKDGILDKAEGLMKQLDVWSTTDKAPTAQGGITGHGAENQILRDLLALGIATHGYVNRSGYTRSDIYNVVMGRIQDEYIPVRNEIYKSGTMNQGSEYGWYRFYWDLYAETLVERMSNGSKTLFNRDDMSKVLYGMLYSRRVDGKFFAEGDNRHTDYWYYNNFNQMTAKLAGDLFNDEYFKGEYRMMRGTDDFSNSNFKDARSFNAVNWLIMNNPNVGFTTGTGGGRNALPKSKYFGGPIGKIYAKTEWTYQQKKGGTLDSGCASAEMKIGELYTSNHDHLDAGTFQIFYRGLMTGDYNNENDYGDSYDLDYYKRTVAHNALTIYNPSENFKYGTDFIGTRSNDGGQSSAAETNTFSALSNKPYNRASVVNHAIASDNSYSYIKGDITAAYNGFTTKASEVARSMAFIPTGSANAPAVMVVFDKVKSSQASYAKKFLLHTASEPTVSGNTVTYDNTNTLAYTNGSVTNNGRLTMNTLLPANPTITKITGAKVNTTTYTNPLTESKYEPEWGRVEVSASSSSDTTKFLNVITVSDTGTTPAAAEMVGSENDDLVGAKTAYGQVAMFANTGKNSLSKAASFTVSGEDTDLDYFVFGLANGRWMIKKGSSVLSVVEVVDDAGALSFTGDAGTYSVVPFSADNMDATVAASYKVSENSGMDYDSESTVWADLTGNGNDIEVALDSNTYWTEEGLKVTGSSNVTTLPSGVQSLLNSGAYTLEFAVSDVSNNAPGKTISLFGNVKNNFAIYKVIGADNIYFKVPGSKTVISRAKTQLNKVSGHHCIISVNKATRQIVWYVDGQKVTDASYIGTADVSPISLVSELGNGVTYKEIKVLSIAVNDSEALGEYNTYMGN